jgi:hypothetical protein
VVVAVVVVATQGQEPSGQVALVAVALGTVALVVPILAVVVAVLGLLAVMLVRAEKVLSFCVTQILHQRHQL